MTRGLTVLPTVRRSSHNPPKRRVPGDGELKCASIY